ncbi:MAG: 2-oxo-tetronate isomerase [Dehalococcoidia bacterium]
MTKLAANLSMMFNEVDFLDRFDAAASAGFKGVEYLFPYAFPKDAIKEKLEKNGLTQVLFDFYAGDWDAGERGLAIHPDRVGEFQDTVGQALDYAKTLGCTRLTCLAGLAPNEHASDTFTQTLVDNLKFASKQVEGTGITVLLEPINTRDIPGFFVNTTAQGRQIIEAVGADNVKLQYDIYHMQIMEGDLAPTIEANMDVIHHFQIADNPGRNEPGTGEINYDFLLPYIDSLGYDGWVGCEYKPKGKTTDGLGWAKKWLS